MSNSDDDDIPKVKLFSGEETIKLLGEILANPLGKKLVKVLKKGPYIKNEMAKILDVPFPLIAHHLTKLIEMDCVEHSKKMIGKGKVPRNAYKLKGNLWTFDPENLEDERIDDNKLRRFFKDSVKFASVVFTGIITYFGLTSSYIKTEIDIDSVIISDDLSDIPTKLDITTFIEHTYEIDFFVVYLVTLIVISTNLFIIWFTKKFK